MEIKPFNVYVPDEVLIDLKDRLLKTRWPDEMQDAGWQYGSNLAYMKELINYWTNDFDWRFQEKRINSFNNFYTDIDGQGIHFIHERGKGPNPLPLLITHGWPDSCAGLLGIIPMLTDPVKYGGDPRDAFDVVVPSLPGYGFSARPTDSVMTLPRVAEIWAKLMKGLGYTRYGSHGGDWGVSVSARLAFDFPEEVIGIHVTWVVPSPYLGPESEELTEVELTMKAGNENWRKTEGAYFSQQATKPQTLAYGLNDSPAALAAWIVEKYRSWGDCNGNIESRFSKDDLLTNIMIYWATETINSSFALYYDAGHNPWVFGKNERIEVPCAVANFPAEIVKYPKEWAERCYNLHRWTEFPRGGHFAAQEEPDLLVQDIREFFRPFRNVTS